MITNLSFATNLPNIHWFVLLKYNNADLHSYEKKSSEKWTNVGYNDEKQVFVRTKAVQKISLFIEPPLYAENTFYSSKTTHYYSLLELELKPSSNIIIYSIHYSYWFSCYK